jgi:hypothetical protein
LELKQRQQTQNQARDTGLALLLILLLIAYFSENVTLIIPGIGVLVLIMVWPKVGTILVRAVERIRYDRIENHTIFTLFSDCHASRHF